MSQTSTQSLPFLAITGLASAMLIWAGTQNPALAISVGNFVHVPLFMAALGLGHRGAAGSALMGALGLFALSFLSQSNASTGLPLVFLIFVGLPGVILGYTALLSRVNAAGQRVWYPLGNIVCWWLGLLAGVYTALLAGAQFFTGDFFVRLQSEIAALILQQMPPEAAMPPEQLQAMVGDVLPYLPGVIMAFVLLTLVVNAIIAQWLLLRMERAQRPMPQMAEISLTPNLSWAVLGLIACVLFLSADNIAQVWAVNVLALLSTALMLAGLAWVHAKVAPSPQRMLILAGVYAALVASPLIAFLPVVLLAGLGLSDHWLRGRNKTPAQLS